MLAGRRGPRVIRTPDCPWGLTSLGIRELRQLIFGSTLLLYMVESFVLMALGGGPALLEHPAEPADTRCVSIWRLALVVFVEQLPGVARYDVWQGCMGSESAKPTSLLSANMHSLSRHLKQHCLWKSPTAETSIGLDAGGEFRTAKLKEYPPALNRALAHSFADAVRALPVDCGVSVPEDFKARCRKLQCATFGDHYGPDYAPT